MFCLNCGATLGATAKFCTACGAAVAPSAPASPQPAMAAPPPPPPMGAPVRWTPAPQRGGGLSSGAKVGIAVLLVVVILGAAAGVILFAGGGATGTCVGVSYNGSYYDYTRVYGYTGAECDRWCSEHSFGTNCYWEP